MSCVDGAHTGLCSAVSATFVDIDLEVDAVFFLESLVFVVGLLIDLVRGVREVMVTVELNATACSAYDKAESTCVSVRHGILPDHVMSI